MKKLIFIFVAITLFACSSRDFSPKNTTISGTVENQNSAKLTLIHGDIKMSIDLDTNGTFIAELPDLKEGYYTLYDSVESTKLYIIPGKDFKLKLNTKEFDESLSYEGEGAAVNNYLAKKYIHKEQNQIDNFQLYSASEEDFLKSIDKIAKEGLDFLTEYQNLPSGFIEMEKKAFNFEKLSMLRNYKMAHTYFAKVPDFEVSEGFLKPLEELDMDSEEDFINFDSYKQLVLSHFTNNDIMENIKNLKSIQSAVIKKEILNNLQYAMRPGLENLDSIYNGLAASSDNQAYKDKISSLYEKYKKLVKGNPSPSFNYEDINGKMIKLNDFIGKNIYIDVWATWCGPCKAEIPALKKLESEYHDKNIEFVSISVDKLKDKDKWVAMVKDKELKGVQLFSDKDWSSEFVQDYAIQGIPRFILVDASGNIVSADAPRPSSDSKIREMIDELPGI